jgi:hypothetical protein
MTMPSTPRHREAITLAHPAFVLSLALLLANDFVFKAAYPGWVTGKLSDVAGLFVLPYFLAWLWPQRRTALHVAVVLAFVAWKLPVSRQFVALWNAAPWFDIARVEDVSDCLALPMVAASWLATRHAAHRVVHVPSVALALVALFAFTATSRPPPRTEFRGTYYFPGTVEEFRQRVAGLGNAAYEAKPLGEHEAARASRVGAWRVDATYDDEGFTGRECSGLSYEFDVAQAGAVLLFDLRAMYGHCDLDGDDNRDAVCEFNERFARPVGLRPLRPVPPPQSQPESGSCPPPQDPVANETNPICPDAT